MQFTLFLAAMAWATAANTIAEHAAAGIAARFQLGLIESLLEAAFLLFLAVVGFHALDWIATRGRFAADTLPLPRRSGWRREWGVGAAIGWGLALAAVAPVLLTGNLHGSLVWNANSTAALIAAIAAMLVSSLAIEVVFHGYAFRRLIDAIGPTWAAILVSVVYAALVVRANPPRNALVATIDCTLFALLLAMAWLRTHALWLGWGLRFAYRAVMTLILGLPAAGRGEFGSPTDMYVTGPRWLTGGAFGLDAALLTSLVMIGGMIVLYRATRDYAWAYTHPPIIAGGYEVTVAPPAAHVAMEKSAPPPPPLVQIMPTTPQTRSVVEQPVESEPTT
jgi:membrane protease YdiL (CAAX protease family)